MVSVFSQEDDVSGFHGLMTVIAEGDQIPEFVDPPLRPILDVMSMEVPSASAPSAPPSVTLKDLRP